MKLFKLFSLKPQRKKLKFRYN